MWFLMPIEEAKAALSHPLGKKGIQGGQIQYSSLQFPMPRQHRGSRGYYPLQQLIISRMRLNYLGSI